MYTPFFLIVTTVTVTHQPISILYQALQRPHQFVGHVSGILGNAESRARVYGSEVRVVTNSKTFLSPAGLPRHF